jgi:hypothetical protein
MPKENSNESAVAAAILRIPDSFFVFMPSPYCGLPTTARTTSISLGDPFAICELQGSR